MTEQTDQLFQKACLLQMTTSIWQASKSIDSKMLTHLGPNSEWVKGRKHLINPELLGQIKTAVHQARNKVQKYALPFPLQSVHLVPKESIQDVEDILKHYESRFWHGVHELETVYASAREEAKTVLGELFDENDYPENIESKFKFTWQFLALQVPGQTTILPPEIYEREKQKFQNMVEETRRLSIQALRTEFQSILHNLVEKLQGNGGRQKIISNQMFHKLNDFLDSLERKNLFQDEELDNLANQARETIQNVSPSSLKYNSELREAIREEMQTLKSTVEESITDMPRRQLTLETEAN